MKKIFLLSILIPNLAFSARFEFREKMKGYVLFENKKERVVFRGHIIIPDFEKFKNDPNHVAQLKAKLIWKDKVFLVDGEFQLMSQSSKEKGHFLVYKAFSENLEGVRIRIEGKKTVYNDKILDIVNDVTVLKGWMESNVSGTDLIYPLKLRFQWENPINMMKFIASFKVTRAKSKKEKTKVIFDFMKIWMGGVFNEYLKKAKKEDLALFENI